MADPLLPGTVLAILLGQGAVAVLTHCPGMCGPLLIAFRLQGPGAGITGVLAYQAGRATVYAPLGAAAGALGGVLTGALNQVLPWASLGLAVVLAGIAVLHLVHRLPRLPGGTPAFLGRLVGATVGRGPAAAYVLGLGMATLPCGLVLWVLGLAAATGTPLAGAMTMLGLVALSTPVLLAAHLAGRGATAPFARWRARLGWLGPVLLLLSAGWLGQAAVHRLFPATPLLCQVGP